MLLAKFAGRGTAPVWRIACAAGFFLSITSAPLAAACNAGDVGGTVFLEWPLNGDNTNTYGVRDSNEPGVSNVQVRVVDASGAEQVTSSASDGSWSVSDASFPVRVEFSWSETWLSPSPQASTGSSVQFAAASDCDLNLALYDPATYSQANPQVATTAFTVGDPSAPEVQGKQGVLEFAYQSGAMGRDFDVSTTKDEVLEEEVTDIAISATPDSVYGSGNAMAPTAGASKIVNASLDQIGAVYGLAYHREANALFAAAYMKRFSGFLEGPSNTRLGSIYGLDRNASPNTLSTFFTADAGLDTHDYSTSSLGSPDGDDAAANNVGKAGWADIDLSHDGNTLYAVNLFDKAIYAIEVTQDDNGVSAGNHTTINYPNALSSGVCADGEWVPGALNVHRREVYVSVTCTAETSQLPANLQHFVYKFPVDDPSNFTQVAHLPYYEREGGYFSNNWNPWTTASVLDGLAGDTDDVRRYAYPQPWLTDIEFDEHGKIYLALRNRSGDMRAAFNSDMQPSYEYGDTVAGAPNGDGTYDMQVATQPALYEFIDDNTLVNTASTEHLENDQGSLAILVGSGELLTPAAIGNLVQGIRTYDTVDGSDMSLDAAAPLSYYGLLQSSRENAIGNPFGKAASLGDLEILSMPAPVEVGNRVWLDGNGDGIQDPDEAGLDNVTVSLLCGLDSATTTTADGGLYHFSNAADGNATFMDSGEACTLRIDNNQAALSTYNLSPSNAENDSSNHPSTDKRDSDASMQSDMADILFTVAAAGENNHSLDFGWVSVPEADLRMSKSVEPNTVLRGETALFTLTVSNQGSSDASGVIVSDSLPDSLLYVSDDSGGAYDPSTGTWTVGDIAAGAVRTLVITARTLDVPVATSAGGDEAITNCTEVTRANEFDPSSTPGNKGSITAIAEAVNAGTQEDDEACATLNVQAVYDWGDAPASYGTQQADDGAVHEVYPGLKLGRIIDAETDGQASEGAEGDNNAINNDEEGINTALVFKNGQALTLNITASNASSVAATAMCWSDYNGDGVFASDGSESGSVTVPAGSDAVDFDVSMPVMPENASRLTGGTSYLRCRLSTADLDATQATGRLPDGEVEDYQWSIEVGEPLNLGDRIWIDSDLDGLQGENEMGLSEATVSLTTASGQPVNHLTGGAVTAQTTDQQGLYQFTDLPAGEYRLEVQPPAGYYLTNGGADIDTSESNSDSNCLVDTANSSVIAMPDLSLARASEPNESVDGDDTDGNLTADCGFYRAVSVGDTIWEDTNANGQQDASEGGLAGAQVVLTEADGVTPVIDLDGNEVASVTTGSEGTYRFERLKPASYSLTVIPPSEAGYQLTQGGADPDQDNSSSDSNCVAQDGGFRTPTFDLFAPAEQAMADYHNPNVDCGFYRTVSVGDSVWLDRNGDGTRSDNDEGIPNVTVNLLDSNDQPAVNIFGETVSPVKTDQTGRYRFSLLPEGAYKVSVSIPNGYLPTLSIPDPNTDLVNDSNGIDQVNRSTINSQAVDLSFGDEPVDEDGDSSSNLTVGFGFVPQPQDSVQIPTLNQWGIILLSGLLALFVWRRRAF